MLTDNEVPLSPTAINAITFSADGTRLAVASVNGIAVYDTYTGEVLALLPASMSHVTALAFSPDSRIVASATEDATIHLWNTHTHEHITDFTNPTDPVVALAFSPDGNTLAGGSLKEIRLWDLTLGQMSRATVLHGHRDMVTTLAFSPDSKTLASASFYGTILLWDSDTSQLRLRLSAHTDSIPALAFSPDNQMLASGGYWNSDAESTIRVWDTQTGQLLTTFENHTTPVFALAFADIHGFNGSTLVSAGWDHTIRMWDPHTEQLQAILGEYTAPVFDLAFLPNTDGPDGTVLASASLDGTVQLRALTTSLLQAPWDVNNDGIVNILDLTFVASRFGQNSPDLNGDGVVNILDLTLVAQHIG